MFLKNYFTFDYVFFRSVYLAFGVMTLTFLVGFVVSVLIDEKKVFSYRYLFLFLGISTIVLIEQNLVYFNIPIKESYLWLLVIILVLLAGVVVKGGLRYLKLDIFVLCLSVGVWVVNGFGYLRESAKWYIGYGWQDQYNYMVTAEFLKEYEFNTEITDINTPYLVQPIAKKSDRIGQSIYQAFMSSVFNLSSEYTYGAVSLVAPVLTYFAFLYLFSLIKIKDLVAKLMSFVAAVLPATSVIHLECFLSQALATPFLLVVLFKIISLDVRNISIKDILVISLLAAGTNSIYTEYTLFILLVLVVKILFVTIKRKNLVKYYSILFFILFFALAMNIHYFVSTISIFKRTNMVGVLTHVYPFNGTEYGYSRLLFGDLLTSNNMVLFVITILFFSAGLIGLILLWVDQKSLVTMIMICFCVVPVLLNIFMSDYSYQTYKLMLSFTPLTVLGWGFIFHKLYDKRRSCFFLMIVNLVLLVVVFAPAYFTLKLSHLSYLGGGRSIKHLVNTEKQREIYKELEAIKDKDIFINSSHPYESARMAYFGRHNQVWFLNPVLGDYNTVDIPNFKYIKIEEIPDDVIVINGTFFFPSVDEGLGVYAFIHGSVEGSKGNMWTWLGKSTGMNIYSKEDKIINISFSAHCGPANSDRKRTVKITNLNTGESNEFTFVDKIVDKKVKFFVKKGMNEFLFKTLYPQEVEYIPENDKRIFMVMIKNLKIF